MLLRLTTIILAFLVWVPVARAWSWPVQGPVLQKFQYAEAHPYAPGQHRGVDIGAPASGGPVVAPASGTVSFAGAVPTSGNCVTIETPDGYSVTLTHLGSIAVTNGASVAEGSVLGTVGPSGTPEQPGPYVHLGIRLSSDSLGYVDPLGLLPAVAPQPAAGGTPSSGSAGVAVGSSSGSAAPAPAPPAPAPEPAQPVAASSAAHGGAGLVLRTRPSAPAATWPVPRVGEHGATSRKRPAHAKARPAETVSRPRTFEGTVVEQTGQSRPVPMRAAPTDELPESRSVPFVLAAGPGVVAALAAIATALLRRRRPGASPAEVVRLPKAHPLRRAA